MIEEIPKKSIEEIIEYVKQFTSYEISSLGTEWNCELCGRWNGKKGQGVDNAIHLYNNGEFEGDIVSLGSNCLKKVLDKLGEIK